ncbi:MAG: hypothetical protein M3044_00565 [Thermoproteota archaeon]|nr:hypothetical protein [Thermoproteota archaeon]
MVFRRAISANDIAKSLGYGTSSYTSFITSITLAIISFFYIFTVANYFSIQIFFFQNRITYQTPFSLYLIGGYIDQLLIVIGLSVWLIFSLRIETKMTYAVTIVFGVLIALSMAAHLDILVLVIALLSIPLCTSFLIYNRSSITKRKFLNAQTRLLFTNHVALVATVVGLISAISILSKDLHLFTSQPGYLALHDYAYQIFDLFSDLSPVAIFLLVLCIPVKLIMNASRKALLRIKKKEPRSFENVQGAASHNEKNGKISDADTELDINDHVRIRTRTIFIYLALFMLLSVILVIIPHLPSVNRDNQQIGSDSESYVNWTNALIHSNNALNFTKQVFLIQSSGERPLSLIFIYSLVKLFDGQNPLTIIEYLPLILGPLLVFVTYFLTRELTSNDKTSLFASFLTAVSFQTLIGIYAGYYANWIGLIFGYSSIIFLIRFLKKRTKWNLALFSVLTISMLFSHQYTWTVFAIFMFVVLTVLILMRLEIGFHYSRIGIIILILIVLLPLVFEIGRTIAIGSSGGLLQDVSKAQAGLSANNFAARWSTLKDTVFVYLGGQLSNFIILFLGVCWLITSKFQQLSSLFIFIFLSIGIIPIFFGDQLTQGRILYDIPFQIPAALGLARLTKQRGNVLLVPICIWLVVLSVRAAANFYLVPSPS